MKYSHKWLQDYLEDELPDPKVVVETLNLKAFEVEGVENKLYTIDGEEINDTIYDIKVLPNRAHDALSHYYMAHELAACLDLKRKYYDFSKSKYLENSHDKEDIMPSGQIRIDVSIKEKEACSRFAYAYITNIKVGDSPEIIKRRLEAIGERSINNIVDITNYVQYSINKPMHAYDADILNGDIVVRYDGESEELITLDDKSLKLSFSDLVIADTDKVLGLAGVKGGKYSGITSGTVNIFIESANFTPTIIRKSSMRHNIKTDASKRFENGLSGELVIEGLSMTLDLIREHIPEANIVYTGDTNGEDKKVYKIEVSLSEVNDILGSKIKEEELVNILSRLDFKFLKQNDVYAVTVNNKRLDLLCREDIVEEIGRIYGYEKLERILPEIKDKGSMNSWSKASSLIREKLLSYNFSEVINYSLVKNGEIKILKSASDKSFLRTNLSEGLLVSVNKNIQNMPLLNTNIIKVFELGHVWINGKEEMHLAISIDDGKKKSNFTNEIEEVISIIKASLSIDLHFQVTSDKPLIYETVIRSGSDFDSIKMRDGIINYEKNEEGKYKSFSLMPFIVRDIAFWIGEKSEVGEIENLIRSNAGDLCISVTLFDSFNKDGKTSYAYRLIYQAIDRTLTDEEVNSYSDKVYNKLTKYGAIIR